jgi:hypothetical protein
VPDKIPGLIADELRSDARVVLNHEHGNLRRSYAYTVGPRRCGGKSIKSS